MTLFPPCSDMEFKNDGSWLECPIPECRDDEYEEVAWGLKWQDTFRKMTINRPKVFGAMVKLEMKFCGVCHSDKHLALNEVPGKSMGDLCRLNWAPVPKPLTFSSFIFILKIAERGKTVSSDSTKPPSQLLGGSLNCQLNYGHG